MKQWILQVIAGAALAGFGLALLLVSWFTLWPLHYLLSALVLCLVGIGNVIYVVHKQERSLPSPAPLPAKPDADADSPTVQTSQANAPAKVRRPDPKIVAIGGGTGMPQLLRGLRAYTDHITAIVTVADDGGSSGRLRRQMGVLPPGDFRNNIAALSEAEQLMTRLFQYRFADHDVGGNSTELAGHSFGNLFITTMAAVTGNFETGLAESSRVLAVRGRVLPSTLEHITLCAEICLTQPDGAEEWRTIEGESSITQAGGRIVRVFLKPDQPRAYPAVIKAILEADLIVAGPGSFFTSVMPNLLVPAIREAICASQAPRIYLCNVATQSGETDDFTVSDHMRFLRQHAGNAFHTVLANRQYDPATAPSHNAQWVTLPKPDEPRDYQLFTGDVVDPIHPWRHSSQKLAARLMEVFSELSRETRDAQDFVLDA
jgi:uncharacterized cofD-like protein